jgi:hypothetical protein
LEKEDHVRFFEAFFEEAAKVNIWGKSLKVCFGEVQGSWQCSVGSCPDDLNPEWD